MLFHYAILGIFACTAGLVLGSSDGSTATVYKCAPNQPSRCLINTVTLENPNTEFSLINAEEKKTLTLKAGRIEALLPKHCQHLSNFEKIIIGKVGLKELCFATSFVEVNAEHNRIKTLHVEDGSYRVETLRLSNNQLQSIDNICKFDALKVLHLEQNFLSTLDMACFAQMKQLKELHLAHNRLNLITSKITELELPALEFIGLQNNTLTALDLHLWSLPALLKLELSSNNLTNVRGLEQLDILSEISLARNRWQCAELDQMLETVEKNEVTVKDGDENCIGIRNSTICCTYEQQPTEQTLSDELKKFSKLEKQYDEAKVELGDRIKSEFDLFDRKIKELQETNVQQYEKPSEDKECTADEESTTGLPNPEEPDPEKKVLPKAPECSPVCICSKESMDKVQAMLKDMEDRITENNVKLQTLLENKSQFAYMSTLEKHEFRTAVKRGEYKLKELSSMLAMLRDHINQKQKRH
uniref:Leucine-rich immune protein (Short) n=1 Tax=Anopheles funestus TaxID=62324 RepID=A0A182RSM1_ANOFN